uniref:Uncharacterized protein n=1 Tax=Nothobranchius furzeri TaxID=105023 RepID=A0A8C6MEM8_NOTFU
QMSSCQLATATEEAAEVELTHPPSSSKAAAFTEAFLKNSIKTPARLDLDTLLAHKAVILGYTRPKKDTTKRKSKKAKGLGARQKRVMKIFQIKAEHQRYELFLPLHQLWRHYILDLCGGLKLLGGELVKCHNIVLDQKFKWSLQWDLC